ncbi:MAG TPA: FAD-binding oxidoreductase [Acidimicrobiales bacterium]|nr:FAD-binding oxidoreductase [Acidimicrobiales bacterium]
MNLIHPEDARYDDARTVFNAMVDKRPAVIAECASPTDVVHALALARERVYDVAVRAGGHSVAGLSMNDDGLVVDVRPMKDIEVDPKRRWARVGAGVTWGEFDRAAQAHGLATTGGRASTTGVAGFTLGGGSGWLERAYGLTCDNLEAVELVTADGRQVRASETENADLFWALHGGGGNFGVATAFEFRMHAVGPSVLAGLMLWPGDAGYDVARAYRDFAFDAPDEFGSGLVFLTGPPEEFVPEQLRGTTVAAVAVCWTGAVDDGQDIVQPLRDLGPAADLVGPMPYADFQCMIDDPPGLYNYWTADYHDTFPDEALRVFVKYGFERQSPFVQQILIPWGGAVARVAEDATPLAQRTATWLSHPFALWEDPGDTDANIAWARGFRRDIARYATGGAYLNFIGNEGQERVRAAFGDEKYARLAAIKAEWDPDNTFRGNQNIVPAS